MNIKRKLLLSGIVLIGTLLFAVFASASTSQAAEGKVVGTWNINVPTSDAGTPPALVLYTFHEDGTSVGSATSVGEGPEHGVWARQGKIFVGTFEAFIFDATGNSTGRIHVRFSFAFSDADHTSGKYIVDFIDPNGQVTPNVDSGPFTGTRLKLDAAP